MIRYKRPDKNNALSVINAAKRDMDFTLSLKIDEKSGSTIIRNIYESFRMLGEALLMAKGIKSIDHITPINELLKMRVITDRPISLVDNLRKVRHNINYNGYSPRIIEIKDAISLAKSCFYPLYKEVFKEVNN